MRRYDDHIEVRSGSGDDRLPKGAPEIFIWRGRLYRVRCVVDRWVERRPWWREVFERPRTALDDALGSATGVGPGVVLPSSQQGDTGGFAARELRSRNPALAVADLEREVWRVEAAAGASFADGTYDLARSGDTPNQGHSQSWRLLAMAD